MAGWGLVAPGWGPVARGHRYDLSEPEIMGRKLYLDKREGRRMAALLRQMLVIMTNRQALSLRHL